MRPLVVREGILCTVVLVGVTSECAARWWLMDIRDRLASDLPACVALAQVVHEADGYPPYLGDGLETFIATKTSLATWVATIDDALVGHVALNPRSSTEVMDLTNRVLGIPAEQIAVVARLLVSPSHRRQGIGKALLETATIEARARKRKAVLDVASHFGGAIALYEKCGWTRIGTVTARMTDGSQLHEHVYVAP